jgi:NitT/TauT family transport system permease protein
MRDRGVQLVSLVAFVLLWAVVSVVIGTKILPGPVDVAPAFGRLVSTGQFLGPLFESLSRTAIGFVVGFFAGLAFGIATAKARWFSISASPLLNILLFAPTLVIIFLAIAILGTGTIAVAFIVGVTVAPNVAIYTRDVMRDFDPELVSMADSFQVDTRQRIRDMYLPYLIPAMLAAARIGFSMSWKVIMLSEVFGFPGGLGFHIRINYTVYNLTQLLAWLAVFVIALLLIEQLLRETERAVVRWQS